MEGRQPMRRRMDIDDDSSPTHESSSTFTWEEVDADEECQHRRQQEDTSQTRGILAALLSWKALLILALVILALVILWRSVDRSNAYDDGSRTAMEAMEGGHAEGRYWMEVIQDWRRAGEEALADGLMLELQRHWNPDSDSFKEGLKFGLEKATQQQQQVSASVLLVKIYGIMTSASTLASSTQALQVSDEAASSQQRRLSAFENGMNAAKRMRERAMQQHEKSPKNVSEAFEKGLKDGFSQALKAQQNTEAEIQARELQNEKLLKQQRKARGKVENITRNAVSMSMAFMRDVGSALLALKLLEDVVVIA